MTSNLRHFTNSMEAAVWVRTNPAYSEGLSETQARVTSEYAHTGAQVFSAEELAVRAAATAVEAISRAEMPQAA